MLNRTLGFISLMLALSFATPPMAEGDVPASKSKPSSSSSRSVHCSNLLIILNTAQSDADDARRSVKALERSDTKAKNRIRKDNEKRNNLENKLAKETNANKRKALQKRIDAIALRIAAAQKERQSYAKSIRDWQSTIRTRDRKVAKLEREKRRTKCK